MTSQGAHINGLDAYKWISAGYACHIHGSKKKANIRPVYDERDDISAPIDLITDGTTVGFRYLQFGNNAPKSVTLLLDEAKKVKINLRIDSYRGRIVSTLTFDGSSKEACAFLNTGLVGKHAVYFEFVSEDKDGVYSFDRFTFD